MITIRCPLKLKTAVVLVGVLVASPLPAQTVDQLLTNYIQAMNNITAKLTTITDAHTAQVNGPDLDVEIANYNALQPQVEAAFANAANKPIFDAKASALTTAQNNLATQRMRFTNNCGQEGAIKSLNSNENIQITFKNGLAEPVTMYWLDYTGKRVSYGTLSPGQTGGLSTYKTHPWVFANAAGACVGLLEPKISANIIVTPDLSPSIGDSLKRMVGGGSL